MRRQSQTCVLWTVLRRHLLSLHVLPFSYVRVRVDADELAVVRGGSQLINEEVRDALEWHARPEKSL